MPTSKSFEALAAELSANRNRSTTVVFHQTAGNGQLEIYQHAHTGTRTVMSIRLCVTGPLAAYMHINDGRDGIVNGTASEMAGVIGWWLEKNRQAGAAGLSREEEATLSALPKVEPQDAYCPCSLAIEPHIVPFGPLLSVSQWLLSYGE